MTKATELFAIANEIAGEDVSGNYRQTIVGAIDALTDVLAGSDVAVGGTIADAIRTMGGYIGSGGGGGGELKGLVSISFSGSKFDAAPAWISSEEPASGMPEDGKTYAFFRLSSSGTTQITGGAWLAIPKAMTLTRFTVTDPDGNTEEVTSEGTVLVWQVPDTYAGDSSKTYTLA